MGECTDPSAPSHQLPHRVARFAKRADALSTSGATSLVTGSARHRRGL